MATGLARKGRGRGRGRERWEMKGEEVHNVRSTVLSLPPRLGRRQLVLFRVGPAPLLLGGRLVVEARLSLGQGHQVGRYLAIGAAVQGGLAGEPVSRRGRRARVGRLVVVAL